MKINKIKAFTLVELLVVITILSIISVVAYQNFGGAVDKAVSGRKINDVSTIETALQQFKVDNNYYPSTGEYNVSSNMWGYNSSTTAKISNTIVVNYNGEEISAISSADGGGKIYGIGTWADGQAATKKQIGAKGTISRDNLGKKYLSKDLYDPEIGEIKVGGSGIMIDNGLGRYVYATYKKNKGEGAQGEWASNFKGVAYNIAYTIKKEGSDKYITKIVGDYDEESCYDDKAKCPPTLIGLTDGQEESGESNIDNYGVPYAVKDFASQ